DLEDHVCGGALREQPGSDGEVLLEGQARSVEHLRKQERLTAPPAARARLGEQGAKKAVQVFWRAMVPMWDDQDRDPLGDGGSVVCERPSAEHSVLGGAGGEAATASR